MEHKTNHKKLILGKILNGFYKVQAPDSTISGRISAAPDSPERCLPDNPNISIDPKHPRFTFEFVKRIPHLGKTAMSLVIHLRRTMKALYRNISNVKTAVTPEFLKEFEGYAHSLGIVSIGYTDLEPSYVFKGNSGLMPHAIVLTMEMDKEALDAAPHPKTFSMVIDTYDALGKATYKLAEYLNKNGHAAQAGYPAGGLVLYPLLAIKAGIGWTGKHGLLITPELGPRQRISAIFTNIHNLPQTIENQHQWIEEFCKLCGKCQRACPGKAILSEPIRKNGIALTHINNEKCYPLFMDQYGCSICLKECAFNKTNYDNLKHSNISSK